jgi:hypothetical protein
MNDFSHIIKTGVKPKILQRVETWRAASLLYGDNAETLRRRDTRRLYSDIETTLRKRDTQRRGAPRLHGNIAELRSISQT